MSMPNGGNCTAIAHALIVGGVSGYCEEHGLELLERLDFSQLSSTSITADTHKHTRNQHKHTRQ